MLAMKKPLLLILVFVVTLVAAGQSGTPAYNPAPPAKGAKLPPILPPEQLWGANFQQPYQKKAYLLAAKIPDVIYQQPCYCYCDRIGHNSLHSCYESTHAANCGACLKELYYTYEQTQKHKTPQQIRQGIIQGEWKSVDLDKAAASL
jgi:hypothetical protein